MHSVSSAARKLMEVSEPGVEQLRAYASTPSESASDESIRKVLAASLDVAQTELSSLFGPPRRVGNADDGLIPLWGVFRFAIWQIGVRLLYLAAQREDEDSPPHLMIGATGSASFRYTLSREVSGEYSNKHGCRLKYHVQRGDPQRGVEVKYAGRFDEKTTECLAVFRDSVERLVLQRVGEGVMLVGIDLAIEFVGATSPQNCAVGYELLYQYIESETEPVGNMA
jgi:hypothetical protein